MILVGNGHIRRRSGKARAHQGLRARRGDSPHDPAAGGTGLRAGWAPALPSPPGCHQAGCIHSLPSGSLADRSPNVTDPRRGNARRSAVISSPHLGVFAVAAAGVLCAFPARWTHYLNSVSAAGPVPTPLSLPFLELNSYRVNAV